MRSVTAKGRDGGRGVEGGKGRGEKWRRQVGIAFGNGRGGEG